MTETTHRRIVLARRPSGAPAESDFRLEETPLPEPGAGELLCRTIYLSLDPYMRGRMNAGPSYATPVGIGEVMTGRTVSEVVRSEDPRFEPGDIVFGVGGWQEYACLPADAVRRVDPAHAPISTALGVLGMPGLTAWVGLYEIARPRPGETVVVSAATGAVGMLAGQLARKASCRVVGIAGSAEKCAFAEETLGYHACLSHREPSLGERLAEVCPDGIDVYFENVGGAVLHAVLERMNPFGRVPVCGAIAHYNEAEPPEVPDPTGRLLGAMIRRRLAWQGFIVGDHVHVRERFERAVAGWLAEGGIRYREDLAVGIEATVPAFLGLLEGRNFGKLVVRLGEDPTAPG